MFTVPWSVPTYNRVKLRGSEQLGKSRPQNGVYLQCFIKIKASTSGIPMLCKSNLKIHMEDDPADLVFEDGTNDTPNTNYVKEIQ